MIGTILSIVGGIISLAVLGYGAYLKNRKKREDEVIRKGRRDIVDGNVADVERRIDDILRAQADRDAGVKNG